MSDSLALKREQIKLNKVRIDDTDTQYQTDEPKEKAQKKINGKVYKDLSSFSAKFSHKMRNKNSDVEVILKTLQDASYLEDHSSEVIQIIGNERYDAIKQFLNYKNQPSKLREIIHENGSVSLYTGYAAKKANQILASFIASLDYSELTNPDALSDFAEFNKELKYQISKSKSLSKVDNSLLINSLRGYIHSLLSTAKTAIGDSNIIDESVTVDDFVLSSTNDKIIRDSLGDNSFTPDLAVVAPFILLFPSNEFKKALKAEGVSQTVIDRLDLYSIPSTISRDTFDVSDDASGASLAFTEKTLADVKKFSWSQNGESASLDKVKDLTLVNYRSNNDAFLKEFKEYKRIAAQNAHREIADSPDLIFYTILDQWLNAAYIGLVAANMALKNVISDGIQKNEERLTIASSSELASEMLFVNNDESNDQFNSTATLMFDYACRNMKNFFGEGSIPVSKTAMNVMKDFFSVCLISVQSQKDLYIFRNKVAEYKSIVNVIPELVLPINISEAQPGYTTRIDGSSSAKIAINDMLFFAVKNANMKHYTQNRRTESGLLSNINLFRLVYKLFADGNYEKCVHSFKAGNMIDIPLKGALTLAEILPASDISYRPEFSGLAPCFDLAYLTRKYTANQTTRVGYQRPGIDACFNHKYAVNDGTTSLSSNKPYSFYDMMVGLINQHADYSWVESFCALTHVFKYGHVYNSDLALNYAVPTVYFDENTLNSNIVHYESNSDDTKLVDTNGTKIGFQTLFNLKYKFMETIGIGKDCLWIDSPIELFNEYSGNRSSRKDWALKQLKRAFQYQIYYYKAAEPYLVDNELVHRTDNLIMPIITDNKITGFSSLESQGSDLHYTEKEIKESFLSEVGNINIPISFDFRATSADDIKFTGELCVIPSTEVLAYKISTNLASQIINFDKDNARKLLRINDIIYLTDELYPTEVYFSSRVMTDSFQSNNACVNREVPLQAMINLKILTGEISTNLKDVCHLFSSIFGFSKNYDLAYTNLYVKDSSIGTLTGELLASSNPKGRLSSSRYPEYIYIPSNVKNTGLPELMGSADESDLVSYTTAIGFYGGTLGSIIPNLNGSFRTITKEGKKLLKVRTLSVQTDNNSDTVVLLTKGLIIEKLGLNNPTK